MNTDAIKFCKKSRTPELERPFVRKPKTAPSCAEVETPKIFRGIFEFPVENRNASKEVSNIFRKKHAVCPLQTLRMNKACDEQNVICRLRMFVQVVSGEGGIKWRESAIADPHAPYFVKI